MQKQQPVRFGLAGYGGWGRHHAQIITNTPGAELAFIVNTTGVKPANESISCPFFDSLEEGLESCEIDVLDVVVPNHLHAQYAIHGLQKGLHVLLEKPLASTVDDANKVIAAWESGSQCLYVGYELRLSRLWTKVKSLVDDGTIGDVLWIDIALERHPFRQGSHGWRWNDEAVGNWMIEEAVHHLDLMTWIGNLEGRPHTVSSRFPGSSGTKADHCSVALDFQNGPHATYRYCLTADGHHLVATIYGTEGSLRAEWHGLTDRTRNPIVQLVVRKDSTPQEITLEGHSGELFELEAEIANMVQCVRGTSSPPMSPYDALENLRLAHEIQNAGR
ncbi:Gfo/Idh/MocA family protein [Alicyclobacillus sp. SO9]|uniref:Gfo/Idh/MocA family protein n=1 Tax=Alicyclobacillus sp. SO9 TaxID=2665646 RepID=UPI0018E789CE|nr:Gfo/Idh/MocA family oxidoreductase [Alicyclobacillus sp. SO9]QQE80533.1 Gfo/Idh/MocA family oxidoreductase [Alicyclobacillus sp. SO9]